ncbi:hypothetical protein Scep_030391 [Stephania cephalantha]|uniref:Uncharacterized protein n=1 Tax=Stephania cephalantha TaxID=152367 RepID=A0AAP0DZH2_9MAGN
MQSRGSSNRLSGLVIRSRISALMLSMLASIAAIYVAAHMKLIERRIGGGRTVGSTEDERARRSSSSQQRLRGAFDADEPAAAARREVVTPARSGCGGARNGVEQRCGAALPDRLIPDETQQQWTLGCDFDEARRCDGLLAKKRRMDFGVETSIESHEDARLLALSCLWKSSSGEISTSSWHVSIREVSPVSTGSVPGSTPKGTFPDS